MYFSFGLLLSLRKYFDGDFDDQVGFLSEKNPCLIEKILFKVKNTWNLFRYDSKGTKVTSVTLIW